MAIWQLQSKDNIPEHLLEMSAGDSLIARLLLNRGVSSRQMAKYFLALDEIQESSPLEIPQMDVAFARIKKAIENKQKIFIYGDYDVDGTSSVALLVRAFKMIGKEVHYYVPNRHSEGYGLNKTAVYKIREEKRADLLITCDCGISNLAEIDYANSLGLDVIVTDHHSIPETPPNSVANCNPKTLAAEHPLHFLPGVGVAYKLAELLLQEYAGADAPALSRSLLDLVALGMVADLAPLKSENRFLTIEGLKILAKTSKPGLQELMRICGVDSKVDAEHIGFAMAPRINAAGRLTDASKAVELMLTDSQERAFELAEELDCENKERQTLCQECFEESLDILAEQGTDKSCLVLASEKWNHGVIGIVASRLLERFHLPIFIMAVEGEIAKGSVRSIPLPGLDVFTEMQKIQTKHGIFKKFGGHAAAAGFSIEATRVEEFEEILCDHFSQRFADEDISKLIRVDSSLLLHELNFDFIKRIAKLAPFGLENPAPLFASLHLGIHSWRTLGKSGDHLKIFLKQENYKDHNLTIKNPNKLYEAVLWSRAAEFKEWLFSGNGEKKDISIVYSAKINDFNGQQSLQLEIKDWKDPIEVSSDFYRRFQSWALTSS